MEKYIEKRTDSFDLQEYLNTSDRLNILVRGSYQKNTTIGEYTCILYYKQHRKVFIGQVPNVKSANQTVVLGALEAVKLIKLHGADVCIISSVSLGFKYAEQGKGLYKDDVLKIKEIVEGQGNTLYAIAFTDGGDIIKKIVREQLKNLKN